MLKFQVGDLLKDQDCIGLPDRLSIILDYNKDSKLYTVKHLNGPTILRPFVQSIGSLENWYEHY